MSQELFTSGIQDVGQTLLRGERSSLIVVILKCYQLVFVVDYLMFSHTIELCVSVQAKPIQDN